MNCISCLIQLNIRVFSLLIVITGLFLTPAGAQESALKGDITSDGTIDGRDALKIMRSVEGLEPANAEEVTQGDVFPFPGIDGRIMGDGTLTEDDAYRDSAASGRFDPHE